MFDGGRHPFSASSTSPCFSCSGDVCASSDVFLLSSTVTACGKGPPIAIVPFSSFEKDEADDGEVVAIFFSCEIVIRQCTQLVKGCYILIRFHTQNAGMRSLCMRDLRSYARSGNSSA